MHSTLHPLYSNPFPHLCFPPHSTGTSSMSCSTLQLSPSFSQFQDIIDTALKDYAHRTGKGIPTDPITARLFTCDSPDKVLEVLQEQAHAFNQYRNGDWKVQLMRRLKPTVDILLGLSTSGVFGQGIDLVRQMKLICSSPMFVIHPAESPSSASDICRSWTPTRSLYLFLFPQF